MRISDWSSDVCSSDLIACCAYLNIGGHCARSALESCMSIVDIEPLIALSVTANRSDAPSLLRRTRPLETLMTRTAVVHLWFINPLGYLPQLNKTKRMAHHHRAAGLERPSS